MWDKFDVVGRFPVPLTEPCEKLQTGTSQPSSQQSLLMELQLLRASACGAQCFKASLASCSSLYIVDCHAQFLGWEHFRLLPNTQFCFSSFAMPGWVKGGSFLSVGAPLETKEPICSVNGAPLGTLEAETSP